MDEDSHSDEEILEILKMKKVAVIGMSKNPDKAAHYVPKYLHENGYDITPVNPNAEIILKKECYDEIIDVPGEIDIVDVFRPSKEALDIAKDTVSIKAKVLWLQLGVKSDEAKKIVEDNNIEYIEDRCTKMEYQKHFLKVRQAFPVLQS